MKSIAKRAALILAGVMAAAALTACGDSIISGYTKVQDSVVSGWNSTVEHFKADAPKYSGSTYASGGQNS